VSRKNIQLVSGWGETPFKMMVFNVPNTERIVKGAVGTFKIFVFEALALLLLN